jgi:hypothetical protein
MRSIPDPDPWKTNYDDDLKAVQRIFYLRDQGELLVEVAKGANLEGVGTPWLAGILLFDTHFASDRPAFASGPPLEALASLKVTIFREEMQDTLQRLMQVRMAARKKSS